MNQCSNCKRWQILPVQGSERDDARMIKLNYKNCVQDKSREARARFVHGDTEACGEWEQ